MLLLEKPNRKLAVQGSFRNFNIFLTFLKLFKSLFPLLRIKILESKFFISISLGIHDLFYKFLLHIFIIDISY